MGELAQIGVGGSVVLLALAQMFSYLKARKFDTFTIPKCPIELTVALWEQRLTVAVTNGLNASLKPLLESNGQCLQQLVQNQQQFARSLSLIEGREQGRHER